MPYAASRMSELGFCALVEDLKTNPAGQISLIDLLREDHPIYDHRSSATVTRMRGWILLALAQPLLRDSALLYVLEELDNGHDAYLIAAAARALRRYAKPDAAFAPLLLKAMANIRSHDDVVCLEHYGAFASTGVGTTAIAELLKSMSWMGSQAQAILPDLELIQENRTREYSASFVEDVRQVIATLRTAVQGAETAEDHCCTSASNLGQVLTSPSGQNDAAGIKEVRFEDQDEGGIGFREFFLGHPSVVAFFYTRCTNPRKCSLTIAKLARLQGLLHKRGLSERIHTAAISYDPAFDSPARLRLYGENRGLRMDDHHKLLRATSGFDALRAYFRLGVNYIESVVNRHRIELHVLDINGCISASFVRLEWDEQQVIDQAIKHLTTPQPASEGHPLAAGRFD